MKNTKGQCTNTGRTHFKKGQTPWNKGLKGYHSGKKHWNWKGSRIKSCRGYILIYNPTHPNADQRGYIYEHRFVLEQKIGRYLKSKECSHHINKIIDDNRPENLELSNTHSEHQKKYHIHVKKGHQGFYFPVFHKNFQ